VFSLLAIQAPAQVTVEKVQRAKNLNTDRRNREDMRQIEWMLKNIIELGTITWPNDADVAPDVL
jgi:hypothetical protein